MNICNIEEEGRYGGPQRRTVEVAKEIKKRYSDQGDRITPAFYSGEEGLASRVISALRS